MEQEKGENQNGNKFNLYLIIPTKPNDENGKINSDDQLKPQEQFENENGEIIGGINISFHCDVCKNIFDNYVQKKQWDYQQAMNHLKDNFDKK
jgi:hypothetical protein